MDYLELLKIGTELHASDVHLSVGTCPSARIDGNLIPFIDEKLTVEDLHSLSSQIMNEQLRERFDEAGEVDFAYSVPNTGRFRVNVFRQRGSIAITSRILNSKIPLPEQLGIPQCVTDMVKKKRGLVLVTGATGSGKSTTLASFINVINQTYPYHIITLEDPVEYLHRHSKSVVNQREVGTDTKSYSTGLRAALREDPDVILVGEMRDLETISIAVTAAETGHLVFSTLHTIGAANTIDRIIDVFPPYQQQQIRTQLAEILECVVSQQLIPRKEEKGRALAMEIMLVNSAIRNLIREAKTYQIPTVIQTNRKIGMQTMDDALYDLYMNGVITETSATNFAQDLPALKKRMNLF